MTNFLIADTFTDSLARLSADEQKGVKTTAFDLQLNPANPGMQFHKLDRARDKHFWSVRVSSDIRLIIHRTATSLLLCYVGHHDEAYRWAERRKLETHPTTGAAQLVEIRERVEEIVIPTYVVAEGGGLVDHLPFVNTPEADLLRYGVPPEWLDEVRRATDDTILELADHLPREAAEALLDLATGSIPKGPQPVIAGIDPFEHPDAQRRFRVMKDVEELERALDYPWEKWTVFLHPAQRQSVERSYSGPARISGSAGTGKTVVALHRAVYLARTNPDARILLVTFTDALANALQAKLFRLIGNEPRIAERLDVRAMNTIGRRLYQLNIDQPTIASSDFIQELLSEGAKEGELSRFTLHFLTSEWEDVVDAWGLDTWEAYRDVQRLGRKTRLPEKQREILWSLFTRVRAELAGGGMVTYADMFSRLAAHYMVGKHLPYDFIVVDESQDMSVSQLRFLAAVGRDRPEGLFFAGDLGQRIFQEPFSWKALGIDIRGRSRTLRINYRTSHQIRAQADRLLGPELTDVDGNTEKRRGTVSVFNGPYPIIRVVATPEAEIQLVGQWLLDRIGEGMQSDEIGVFVRSSAELERARTAVESVGLRVTLLDENLETMNETISIGTMHLAKGLEYRAVVVMACDDGIIPSQERIESVGDDTDLEEVFNTERHLLYVACTRARDQLLVTGTTPASEFLDDLRM
jgi:superfamily I DNA/RNA helicase/mRNA-degrading endonuclease RelE of RelBE toxin-antitoxin system